MRYTEFEGGILDQSSGLVWKSQPEDGLFTFEQALKRQNDRWRLPTVHELFGVVDTARYNPATELPNHLPDTYWSVSPSAFLPGLIWFVDFVNGNTCSSDRYYGRSVRLVRR